jgi:hypothetical protein
MDILDAFKSEVFLPLVTLIVPGAIAIAPYPIVTGHYVPKVQLFWNEHSSGFVAILVVSVIASGLILENIGSLIESHLWDRKIGNQDKTHSATWNSYLKLETSDEIVGQRYLRTIPVRLKFELSMIPALLFLWLGLLWVNCLYHMWSLWGFALVTVFVFALNGYLWFESYSSAKNIALIRKLMVEAVKEKFARTPMPKPER